MNNLITTKQLCKVLHISRQTAYKWRKAGCPTVLFSGNICRYNYNEVVEWVNSRRNGR